MYYYYFQNRYQHHCHTVMLISILISTSLYCLSTSLQYNSNLPMMYVGTLDHRIKGTYIHHNVNTTIKGTCNTYDQGYRSMLFIYYYYIIAYVNTIHAFYKSINRE